MKAIVFAPAQSRKSESQSLRHLWLVANVYLRRWVRRAVARHESALLSALMIFSIAGLLAAICGASSRAIAITTLPAIAALTLYLTKLTFDRKEAEL